MKALFPPGAFPGKNQFKTWNYFIIGYKRSPGEKNRKRDETRRS
jgi:hypothetical protein